MPRVQRQRAVGEAGGAGERVERDGALRGRLAAVGAAREAFQLLDVGAERPQPPVQRVRLGGLGREQARQRGREVGRVVVREDVGEGGLAGVEGARGGAVHGQQLGRQGGEAGDGGGEGGDGEGGGGEEGGVGEDAGYERQQGVWDVRDRVGLRGG